METERSSPGSVWRRSTSRPIQGRLRRFSRSPPGRPSSSGSGVPVSARSRLPRRSAGRSRRRSIAWRRPGAIRRSASRRKPGRTPGIARVWKTRCSGRASPQIMASPGRRRPSPPAPSSRPTRRTGPELAAFLALRNGAEERLLELLQLLQCNYPYQATAYHFFGHHLERHKDPGRAELAFKIFATLEPRSEEPFYDLAALDASQGRKDLAFENLKKSIDRGARDLDFIRKDPRLLALHGDPRFARLAGPVPPAPAPKKK